MNEKRIRSGSGLMATSSRRFCLLPSSFCLILVALAASCAPAPIRVGPGETAKSLKSVVEGLKPGDVVEIAPGTYREVMKIRARGTAGAPIVIRGAAGKPRPVFDATGLDVSGKGAVPRSILQIEGAYIVLEHLELTGARNGGSAAGVRLLASTNATIRDCVVHHCDLGVFGDDRETATIENCDVGFNSTEEWRGYAHNFYMHGNRVVVRNCRIHDSPFGQNFKTRAHYNELWYNLIADSDEGEVGPVDEHARVKDGTGLANSNVLMVGNVVISKPKRGGNESKFVLFGAELKDSAGHNGTLYMFNNTLIAGSPEIIFIQLADPGASLVARNNIFLGSQQILKETKPAKAVVGSHNWMPADAKVPAGFTATLAGADPGFVDAERRDFRLKPGSPCAGAGTVALDYVDGDGARHELSLEKCCQSQRGTAPYRTGERPPIGALQASEPK